MSQTQQTYTVSEYYREVQRQLDTICESLMEVDAVADAFVELHADPKCEHPGQQVHDVVIAIRVMAPEPKMYDFPFTIDEDPPDFRRQFWAGLQKAARRAWPKLHEEG